jgi:hypothetical protein
MFVIMSKTCTKARPFRLAVIALALLLSRSAFAQDPDSRSFAPDVLRRVVLDPTLYAPAIIGWGATRLDWNSSQTFFRNGFVEENPRFTISGRPADTPIGYGAGNRKILRDALATLPASLINNVTSQVIAGVLTRRYPTHRKVVRTIGWIERSSLAAYLSYRLSGDHLRQWQTNRTGSLQFVR